MNDERVELAAETQFVSPLPSSLQSLPCLHYQPSAQQGGHYPAPTVTTLNCPTTSFTVPASALKTVPKPFAFVSVRVVGKWHPVKLLCPGAQLYLRFRICVYLSLCICLCVWLSIAVCRGGKMPGDQLLRQGELAASCFANAGVTA